MGSSQNSNKQVENKEDDKDLQAIPISQNNQDIFDPQKKESDSVRLKINDKNENTVENGAKTNRDNEKKESKIEQNSEASEEEEEKKKLDLNRKSVMRKSKLNGITFVQNLKEFFPDDISKKEIRCMVMNALSDCIVANKKNLVVGKNVTIEQSEAISNLVYEKVKSDQNCKIEEYEGDDIRKEKFKILEDVKIKIGMADLTRDIAMRVFAKDKPNATEEINKMLKSQGNDNVKILTIELCSK